MALQEPQCSLSGKTRGFRGANCFYNLDIFDNLHLLCDVAALHTLCDVAAGHIYVVAADHKLCDIAADHRSSPNSSFETWDSWEARHVGPQDTPGKRMQKCSFEQALAKTAQRSRAHPFS
mmetsp:Transcript_31142/g.55325  ORF Transcript_31142/g.55325 Transcript_31142/m.55325 type:complete len:120 (-) Transcript_31142:406-765(-)